MEKLWNFSPKSTSRLLPPLIVIIEFFGLPLRPRPPCSSSFSASEIGPETEKKETHDYLQECF